MKLHLLKPILTLVVLLVVLVFSGSPLIPSAVEAQDSSYTGLDIVFLIDESGSMTLASDQDGIRFQATEFAIEWLGWELLTYDPEHNLDVKAAIVDFSATTQVTLPPYTVSPINRDEWREEFNRLQETLNATERLGDTGGTNFRVAFETAKQLLNEMGQESSNERLKVVVLLTDGLPFGIVETLDEHMALLEDFINNEMPYPEHRLFALGLQNPGEPYWSQVKTTWERITHDNAWQIDDNRTLGRDIQKILGKVGSELKIAPETDVGCGPLIVPPFLKELRLTIHKPVISDEVLVYDANNQLLTNPDPSSPLPAGSPLIDRIGVGTAIEALEVYDPSPGEWRIECPGVTTSPPIFRRDVQMRSELIGSGSNPLLLTPHIFNYKLYDNTGAIKPPYDVNNYNLQAQVIISSGDTTENVGLVWQNEPSAYVGTWLPSHEGPHTVHLLVQAQDSTGQPIVVKDEERPAITVERPQLEFRPFEQWQLLVPTKIKIAMTNPNGHALSLPSELKDSLTFSININNQEGSFSPEEWYVNQNGEIEAVFIPRQNSSHQVNIEATAKDNSGNEVRLANATSPEISPVEPIIKLDFEKLELREGETTILTATMEYQQENDFFELVPTQYHDSIEVETIVTVDGHEQIVPMKLTENNLFVGEHKAEKSGEGNVTASAKAKNPQNGQIIILREHLFDNIKLTVMPGVSGDWPINRIIAVVIMVILVPVIIIFIFCTATGRCRVHNKGYLILYNQESVKTPKSESESAYAKGFKLEGKTQTPFTTHAWKPPGNSQVSGINVRQSAKDAKAKPLRARIDIYMKPDNFHQIKDRIIQQYEPQEDKKKGQKIPVRGTFQLVFLKDLKELDNSPNLPNRDMVEFEEDSK